MRGKSNVERVRMTNVPQLTPPALVTPPAEAPSSGGWSLRRILIVAVGGLFGVFALLFIVALLLSGVSDVEGIGSVSYTHLTLPTNREV